MTYKKGNIVRFNDAFWIKNRSWLDARWRRGVVLQILSQENCVQIFWETENIGNRHSDYISAENPKNLELLISSL